MRIIVSIDDTDDITTKGSKGTGDLAQHLARTVKEMGWGTSSRITRHQLLLHEDIPYTSHNSSMCFEAEIEPRYLQDLIRFSSLYLASESEPKADPGLCIAVVEQLADVKPLIDFGYRAKREVLTKDDAYRLAAGLGIHLTEHGGTGQGVIGALAGAGLRLGGNDGAFKSRHKVGQPGEVLTAARLRDLAKVDAVQDPDGRLLEDHEPVMLGQMVKSILSGGRAVIPVQRDEGKDGSSVWKTCSREHIHLGQRAAR
ncbi:hypothetical protein KIH86_12295 [Paenibacillus sp. HN-1]|uniref:hypothetical protein n=1 Tax=Paenibacillus TaxID=44249 RepID=UPI001CA876BC|nr:MULTISPECIES: hypothetical protein [Paenibacillus]MBY9081484.1 hypothetical protein [Paenibacillus sp. CGMCC 1.18879]MBY9085004.1 hypothetical protein [Paenibacillus sinensis]